LSEKVEFSALVTGGKASGGPPIGPAVGPTGINIKDVVDTINEKTIAFKGLNVPVRIILNPADKTFEIIVETPSTSSLLLKEAGAEKGSSSAGTDIVGDITIEQVIKIAKMKKDKLLATSLKSMVKSILGTCLSIGISVEGENPKEIQKKISNGEFDKKLKE
jgi:large subunit ribosomal protein L11